MNRFAVYASTLVLVWLGHVSLLHADSPVGQRADGFTLKDYRGKEVSLEEFESSRLVVLAFMGTQCPLAKLYYGRLQELTEQYDPSDLTVIALNANVQDSVTEIGAAVRRHGVTYPVLKDLGNKVADALGARRTPEVFLLDQDRIVRYHGRIDDQYLIGVVREQAQRQDLKIAIDELLAGESVSVPETEPIGCFIGRIQEPDESSPVTYFSQIARIFQNHCVECHREGEIAPFSLTSYDDAVGWGETIVEVIRENRMPPWHANPKYGEFANDCSLSEEQKQLIETWVEYGCPEGDPADLPEPQEFVSGWQLEREPDKVFSMREKPFTVPADAGPRGVAYQNFWVDPGFTEDTWIRAAEIRPGNRLVVHHIIVYVHPEGKHTPGDEFLAGYVPGLRIHPLPEKTAKLIPAGSWLRFQVHYTPVGSVQEDLSSIGFIYADPNEVEQVVQTFPIANLKFELEPFEDNQQVTARSPASGDDVHLLAMSPHMHLRGKSFRYEAEYPDGTGEILLDVPRYDFNWQTQYRLVEPKLLPKGTRIHCTALFDNSENNLSNPDPSATVGWGDQSWDEMMIGYVDLLRTRAAFERYRERQQERARERARQREQSPQREQEQQSP
jgi:peroxiredoxin